MRAIVFGLTDVIFRFQLEQRWEAFAGICDLPPDRIRRRLADSGFMEACERGRLRGERALAECGRLLGIRLSMEQFQASWAAGYTPNTEVVQLVKLARNRAASAVLSNNSDIARIGLEAAHPAHLGLFLPRLYSGDLGVMKPDPRSFSAVLRILDLAADQCLFVDGKTHHTAAAASLGFHAHRFETVTGLRSALGEFGVLP
ncbi:MAG: HAD family phosphatase [Pseudomonadales bacterium]|nr:HAD family phosphatase [Pseudomonadales bacterium]